MELSKFRALLETPSHTGLLRRGIHILRNDVATVGCGLNSNKRGLDDALVAKPGAYNKLSTTMHTNKGLLLARLFP